jgi:hypothetical protein
MNAPMTVLFLKQRGAERVKLSALLILDDVSQQTLPAQGAFFFLSAKLVTAIEPTRPTSGGILEFGELALCPITPSA